MYVRLCLATCLTPLFPSGKTIPIASPYLHICIISNLRQLFYFTFGPFCCSSPPLLSTIKVFHFQSSADCKQRLCVCVVFPFGFCLIHTRTPLQQLDWLASVRARAWNCVSQNKICTTNKNYLFCFKKHFCLISRSNLFLKHTINNCYCIPSCTPFLLWSISPSALLVCFLGHICWFQFVAQSQTRTELLNLLIFIFSIASKIKKFIA